MALVYLDSETDVWLVEHEACEKLSRDIMSQLTTRNSHPRSSERYAAISANVRIRLKQFSSEVEQLKVKLSLLSNVTAEETERRHRMIENLHSKYIQMQNLFQDKRDLMQRTELLGWSNDSDDDKPIYGESSSLTNNMLREDQKKLLEEQNEGLENLSKILSRQKDIAVTISNEVDLQNDLVEDITERVDRTNTSIQRGTHHITVVTKMDGTCGYWVVILLLFIAILTVNLV